MFRPHLSALTLLAAFSLPLAAVAQTAPVSQPAGPALAAPPMRAPGRHQHRRHNPYLHALRTLNLTDAQRRQIAGYLKDARVAERQARIASARALRTQIDGVLTPDQRAQLHASLARPHGGPGGPPAAPHAPAE